MARVDLLDGFDEIEPQATREQTPNGIEGIGNVLRRDRDTVAPRGIRMDSKHHRQPVVRDSDAVGQPAVKGTELISRADDQRIGVDPEPCRAPLVGQRRHGIDGALGCLNQQPAFGGIGIQVLQMCEVGRVLEIVKERDAVLEFQAIEYVRGHRWDKR